ncbi:hypothetical protein KC949_00685 [Candidatus Saccharibacteria bacterium]|nr:hypothetical protein [Candidatus Saccharibacteria bacterium]
MSDNIPTPNIEFISDLPGVYANYAISLNTEMLSFAFLWMAYNKAYSEYYNSREPSSDGARFKNYFSKLADPYFVDNKQAIYDNFRATLPNNGRDSVINMHHTSRKVELPGIEEFHTSSLAKLIYQIRCNYIHGAKVMNNEDDQKLVKWAYDILLDVARVRGVHY